MAPGHALILLGASVPTLTDTGLNTAPGISPLQCIHKSYTAAVRHQTRFNDKAVFKQHTQQNCQVLHDVAHPEKNFKNKLVSHGEAWETGPLTGCH
uniref:Putative secreted protein n=1 Tax=Ixodes ricinus TaxID=34613 RepID=A0A6B0UA49_IXORI